MFTDSFSLAVTGIKDFSSAVTFRIGDNKMFQTYLSLVAHSDRVHPSMLLNIDPLNYQIESDWSEVEGLTDYYYIVLKCTDPIQGLLVSQDSRLSMAGYTAVHGLSANTAYGMTTAVPEIGKQKYMLWKSIFWLFLLHPRIRNLSVIVFCCCFVLVFS